MNTLSSKFRIGDVTFATAFPEDHRRAIEHRHGLPNKSWAKVDFCCLGSGYLVLQLAKRNYGDLRKVCVQKYEKIRFEETKAEEVQASTTVTPALASDSEYSSH